MVVQILRHDRYGDDKADGRSEEIRDLGKIKGTSPSRVSGHQATDCGQLMGCWRYSRPAALCYSRWLSGQVGDR